jgi:heme exporter protein CcmD
MKQGGLDAFLAMGGYAFYVWTSFVITVLAIAIEIVAVRARLRAAMRSMSGSQRARVLHDDIQ